MKASTIRPNNQTKGLAPLLAPKAYIATVSLYWNAQRRMHVVLVLSHLRLFTTVAVLCLLGFGTRASANSPAHLRRAQGLEERVDNAFHIDPALIFPPRPSKRALQGRGLLDPLFSILGLGGSSTTTTTQQQPTTTSTPPPVNTPTTDLPAPTQSPYTPGNTPATTTTTTSSGKQDTTNLSLQTNIAQSDPNGVGRHIVTDSNGEFIIPTPIVVTWLSTLPDGSVQTIVETHTPGVDVLPPTSPSKAKLIGAVIGAVIAFFLFAFVGAFAFLMIHKKRRAVLLTRSRPTSASSFGSSSGMRERDSFAPLGLGASAAGYRSSAYSNNADPFRDPAPPISSSNRNLFPPPPSNRLSSASSDMTHSSDFPLPPRKFGVYPAAGSYTPWAYPPSTNGSDETGGQPSPIITSNRISGYEGPFKDVTSSGDTSQSVAPSTWKNPRISRIIAGTSDAPKRGSFGQSRPGSGRSTIDRSERESHGSSSDEYYSVLSRRESDPSVTHEGTTDKHYSYHSAFASHQGTEQNPFSDASAAPAGPSQPLPILSISRSSSHTSSVGKDSSKSSVMEKAPSMAPSPDASQLFYKSQPAIAEEEGRLSRISSASSDGSTIRPFVTYAYPSLLQAAFPDQTLEKKGPN